MEGVLPASLADGADEQQFTRMNMRVGVVGLMRILAREIGIHQIGHGTTVDQEVRRMVRLGLYVEAASHSHLTRTTSCSGCLDLRLDLAVNSGIHLGPLEQVFPVVAAAWVVVGSVRQAEVAFLDSRMCETARSLRGDVQCMVTGVAVCRNGRRKDNESAIQPHLDLEIALRSAVVGVGT